MEEPRLPTMRASDVDRERVLEIVRQSHAEGRLTTPEFYERLESVYQAKTFADLDVVTADLPTWTTPQQVVAPGPQRAVAPAPAPSTSLFASLPAELRNIWMTWAVAVAINVAIWAVVSIARGEASFFWPMWVAGPWGVVNAGFTLTWWLGSRNDPEPPRLPPGGASS